MSDALADAQLENIHLTYYLTSIYDNSIYEAFSKIIQKLIRELPALENLLNVLCSVSFKASFILLKTKTSEIRTRGLIRHTCLIHSQKSTLLLIVHLWICNLMNCVQI